MNFQEADILQIMMLEPFINQRILAETSGHSLGIVNRSLKTLMSEQYLDEDIRLTEKAYQIFRDRAPQNAVILAAGFGMRMVPINLEVPKGLLEVNGEPLIERLIKQLHEVGVTEIYVVVGFMKEQYEYLIDEYGVQLIVNPDYAGKNNLHSLNLVSDHLQNTYIVPCDIWCARNPFNRNELYSWYMISDLISDESDVRLNRKMELVRIPESAGGNTMIGISYLLKEQSDEIRKKISAMCLDSRYDHSFWETALYEKDRMIVPARVVHAKNVIEIDTYEQLREIDMDSNQLQSDALDIIAEVFQISPNDIVDITVLKKGMTNRSFLFSVHGEKYIMRIPGEGTDQLINRWQEAQVYQAISGRGLCDDPIYLNPENGYKITRFLEGVQICDAENISDLKCAMEKLRQFHKLNLQVDHNFDIFGQIDFYEGLWNGKKSVYKDYQKTKEHVFLLKEYINHHAGQKCLTHIDAVPDNFLFYEKDGKRELQLTDWEYAGMQDPHVDIAMFCIYSLYNKRQVDKLINLYFENKCDDSTRIKIYCYIAACGLLWSNWCEYKNQLGVEFGEYSLRQYRFAKDYYRYAVKEMKRDPEKGEEQCTQ